MPDDIDRINVIAAHQITHQRNHRIDLLRRIRRPGHATLCRTRACVDDFDADGGVIDIAAAAPRTDAGMPGPLMFRHHLVNHRAGFAPGRHRHQIMTADFRPGQRTQRARLLAAGVMQHQMIDAGTVGSGRVLMIHPIAIAALGPVGAGGEQRRHAQQNDAPS